MTSAAPLLEVEGLVKHFPVHRSPVDVARRRAASHVHAVDGVSFSVAAGETLAIVGESGSGKTTVGRLVSGLLRPTAGTIRVDGRDVTGESPAKRSQAVQMVFQDPFSSLDPRQRVDAIVREPLDIHGIGDAAARHVRVRELLERVQFPTRLAHAYPHQLSGGLRQRVGIATALALGPRLIVADEPTSALDVSVQAQILDLLVELQQETGIAIILISHDLGVVEQVTDRVAVMYLGRILEQGPVDAVFDSPEQPYTRALLSARLPADPTAEHEPVTLSGDIPTPIDPPPGCPFHTRCWLTQPICAAEMPALLEYAPGHVAACHVTAAEHGLVQHPTDKEAA